MAKGGRVAPKKGGSKQQAREHEKQKLLPVGPPLFGSERCPPGVLKLAPCIPVLPGRGLVQDLVTILLLYELGARWNGVFDQQIFRRRAVHGQMHSERIARHHRTPERVEPVDDLSIFIGGRQLEVVAGKVKRQRSLLIKLLLGGVVLALD